MSAAGPGQTSDVLAEAVIACDVTFVPEECFYVVHNPPDALHGSELRVLVGTQFIPGGGLIGSVLFYDPPEAKRVYLPSSTHENSELPGSYKKRLYTGHEPCTCTERPLDCLVEDHPQARIDTRIDWRDFECIHPNVDFLKLMALPGLRGLDDGDRAEVILRWLNCVYEHVMASDPDRAFRGKISTLHSRVEAAFQARLAARESFPPLPKSSGNRVDVGEGSSADGPKIPTTASCPRTGKTSQADRDRPSANVTFVKPEPKRSAYSLFDDSYEEESDIPNRSTT
ncbi:hypothetical protein LTR95_013507 [Oleoguttula sp. CCFEE 5521]